MLYYALAFHQTHYRSFSSSSSPRLALTEKITFKNAPSPQEFNEGEDADIVCDVVSQPPPNIIWKLKGSKIQVAKDGKKWQQAANGASSTHVEMHWASLIEANIVLHKNYLKTLVTVETDYFLQNTH